MATATATTAESPPIPGLRLAIGASHACALPGDGTVTCWGGFGANYFGQLGDGTTTDSATPVTVVADAGGSSALAGVTAVAAGASHTCALLADTTVKCWGDNEVHPAEPVHYGDQGGQLGNDTMISSLTPVAVVAESGDDGALSGVTAISAGQFST
jgi:alpha-tubulin suppressor-like RCC1 family protein